MPLPRHILTLPAMTDQGSPTNCRGRRRYISMVWPSQLNATGHGDAIPITPFHAWPGICGQNRAALVRTCVNTRTYEHDSYVVPTHHLDAPGFFSLVNMANVSFTSCPSFSRFFSPVYVVSPTVILSPPR